VVSPTRTRRSIIVVLDGVTEKLAETWLSPETRNVSPLKSSNPRRPPRPGAEADVAVAGRRQGRRHEEVVLAAEQRR